MYRKLLLCIILLSTAFISYAQEKKLVFNKDGYFKIVQFTDVHYKYDDQANSQIALDRINEVLDAEHPDFVIFTGDVVVSNEAYKVIDKQLAYYENIGYTIVFNTELDKIKSLLKGKTSVFTGQTGAGKSTLLNRLMPSWNLETGEVSLALGRGKHTTRVVTLYEAFGGKVVDTPGFSALDFHGYSKEEIRDAFIEFSFYSCPFKNCLHTKEVECKIKKAVFIAFICKDFRLQRRQ